MQMSHHIQQQMLTQDIGSSHKIRKAATVSRVRGQAEREHVEESCPRPPSRHWSTPCVRRDSASTQNGRAGVILREQASFFVSVDNLYKEDAMYNPNKWPAGALIRPYKLRTQATRNQQTTRDQRPPRPRTHQEPHARSYRQQAAAQSSNRPTEYTRVRDSYDWKNILQ